RKRQQFLVAPQAVERPGFEVLAREIDLTEFVARVHDPATVRTVVRRCLGVEVLPTIGTDESGKCRRGLHARATTASDKSLPVSCRWLSEMVSTPDSVRIRRAPRCRAWRAIDTVATVLRFRGSPHARDPRRRHRAIRRRDAPRG